jgi:hypothetical protein
MDNDNRPAGVPDGGAVVKLTGKRAWFWLDGFRSGVIKRVEADRHRRLRSLTVKLANGQKRRIGPDRFRGPLAGVMLRGKLVGVDDAIRMGDTGRDAQGGGS